MSIKSLRIEKELTQSQVSKMTNIPLRTYKNYENDPKKIGSIKYDYILNILKNYNVIDRTHGILTIEQIKKITKGVFENKPVDYCILFGSYAAGTAIEISDINLLISSSLSSTQFFDLNEELRQKLKKNIDLYEVVQLLDDPDLMKSVLKEGIRIYSSKQ